MCSVCTVAIIGGVGLSRWLRVDDTISGVWVGAFLVSIIYWTISWLSRHKIKFFLRDFLTAIFYYILVIWPLYSAKIIGHSLNKIFGVDKLVVGIFFGSIVFIFSIGLYFWLKKKNGGHAHFPFEKVAIPVVSLILTSGIFFLITKK
ncbi:MAG: hypothetical protein NTW79_03130 [Candidatus Berkelbacteria bacterium]|nr:hypothetical protein [Candidatus Berkelbacteria bacterium]